jgi:hypothetical protein
MEPRVFLEKALSENGYYCVFAAKSVENKRTQKFYTSVSAVIDSAQELDARGFDAYFALATFEEEGSRKVSNVKQLKSFFLDLDCGPSKDYANQERGARRAANVLHGYQFAKAVYAELWSWSTRLLVP